MCLVSSGNGEIAVLIVAFHEKSAHIFKQSSTLRLLDLISIIIIISRLILCGTLYLRVASEWSLLTTNKWAFKNQRVASKVC